MAAVFRCIEAALLVLMGSFMVVLSRSSSYWHYINPKYAWLTCVAGVLVLVMGCGCFFHVERKRKISELVGLLVFLALAGVATSMPRTFSSDSPAQKPAAFSGGSLTQSYADEDASALEARLVIDDVEYVKINVAELIAGETEGHVAAGGNYAIQGAVVRTPELDQAGYIGVGRLLISCCFADATGVVCLVKVDAPEMYAPGDWVRVAGRLRESTDFSGRELAVTGALTAVRSEHLIMDSVQVSSQQVEGMPFIFEIRGEEPYTY